jgi:hypothetical protein
MDIEAEDTPTLCDEILQWQSYLPDVHAEGLCPSRGGLAIIYEPSRVLHVA